MTDGEKAVERMTHRMSRQLMLPVIALMLSGCVAQINDRSVARWLAADIICSIDETLI